MPGKWIAPPVGHLVKNFYIAHLSGSVHLHTGFYKNNKLCLENPKMFRKKVIFSFKSNFWPAKARNDSSVFFPRAGI